MTPQPRVTVLITTHNYGQFIEHAIDSVLSQDFPLDPVQILVVDDGSTDDTKERIKKYGSRVEYHYKPNGGQASALNFGFAKAQGEIIFLLDADDFFLAGKIATVMDAFANDPNLGMVYHRVREWHVETDTYCAWPSPSISGDILKKPDFFLSYAPQPTSCLAFRRKLMIPFMPIPEEIRMLADCFPASLMPFQSPVLAIPEYLSVYRIHKKNSYYASADSMPPDVRNARLQMWRIAIPAMRKWLMGNGFNRTHLPTRLLFDRWTIYLTSEEFRLQPPGRLRFFRFVLFEIYSVAPMQARKLTAFNYLTAPLALFFGYSRASQMYEWRGRAMAGVERLYEMVFATRRSLARKKENNGHTSP